MTAGEPLVVMEPETRGHLSEVGRFVMRVAGAELNVAIGAARLGIKTAFMGAVGQDPMGMRIREVLQAARVNTDGLQERSEPTGLFFKEWYGLQPEPQVYYYRRESAGSHWACPEPGLPGAQWLHTSGITWMIGPEARLSIEALWRSAAGTVTTRSLDVNLRRKLGPVAAWRDVLGPALSEADVVMATREELDAVAPGFQPRPGQTLVVKRGADGADLIQSSGQTHLPAWPLKVPVVDVVGAGDGFAAGVIAGRIKGWTWERSIGLGTLVGAFAVAHPGDYSGYPTWTEAMRVMDQSWVDR